ncbi:MAG: methyltransferase domain-containing protein [Acidimicrobiales bacterium]
MSSEIEAVLRRWRDVLTSVPGREDQPIADLIVPYRFDIVIRRRLIRTLLDATTPVSDEDLLSRSVTTGYRDWFEQVEVARFRRDLLDDEPASTRALLERLRGVVTLVSEMQSSDGLDRPLVLDWHVRGAHREGGTSDAHPIAPADGCHRIAFLSARGARVLPRREHRRRVRIGRTVLDNTARLLHAQSVAFDDVVATFAEEHDGFAAAVTGDTSHPRGPEFRADPRHTNRMSMSTPASLDEIDRFLKSREFSGYQSVPLGNDREIPGRDRSTEMRALLAPHSVSGRSVLDVGTYYGALPATASDLGATATGLEPDPERHAIAAEAARLAGDRWQIRAGSLEALADDEQFDLVFLLNVIHHIDEPVSFLRRLASHCTGTLVVEFPVAHDISGLRYVWDDIANSGSRPGPVVAARTFFWSRVIRSVSKRIPIAHLGDDDYHRRWHFSVSAFRIIAGSMLDGVDTVSISPSTWNRYRAVATITMAPSPS